MRIGKGTAVAKILWLTAGAAAVVFICNRDITTTTNSRLLVSTSPTVPSHPLLRSSSSFCLSRLDALDRSFDERRQARKDFVKRAFADVSLSKMIRDGRKLFDVYEPEATCIYEERFGQSPLFEKRYQAFGDGPKFVCGGSYIASLVTATSSSSNGSGDNSEGIGNKDHGGTPSCLVYSIGSKNEIEFEASIHKYIGRHCEVHTFDPTLGDEPFIGGEYSAFHPWGLGGDGEEMAITVGRNSEEEYRFTAKSLTTMMSDLGHANRTVDILKIDCEGCEWKVMPKVFESIAAEETKVNQIQIELHSNKGGQPFFGSDQVVDPSYYDDSNDSATSGATMALHLRDFFELADRAQMRIFHKERNAWGSSGGSKCVEYSFVSESFLREVNSQVCGQHY